MSRLRLSGILKLPLASMLSTDLIRELLDDPSLTDDQVEDIRSACHALAEMVFVAWRNGQLEKKSSSEAATDSTLTSGGL